MEQEKIGKFIQKLRKEKQLTQQELALKLGVTDRAISKWENGRGMPDISFLIPLSNILDISVLELLNGERNIEENQAIIQLINNNKKKVNFWKYLFLGIINLILIIMITMLFFGYVIPRKYENNDNLGIIKITSESMKPSFNINDNIIYNKVDINLVKENDIIIYYYKDNNKNILKDYINVHRVIKRDKDENNNIILTTKGDNNLEIDKTYVDKENFLGIYNHKTSWLTNYFLMYGSKLPIIAIVFLLIGIISILFLDIIYMKRLIIKNYRN